MTYCYDKRRCPCGWQGSAASLVNCLCPACGSGMIEQLCSHEHCEALANVGVPHQCAPGGLLLTCAKHAPY